MIPHTPAPWKWSFTQDGSNVVKSQDGTPICILVFNEPANAQVIEAAPDMLDALRDIVAQFEKTQVPVPADLADSIRVFGKAAISKATGGRP
jgi:hypothetical protein